MTKPVPSLSESFKGAFDVGAAVNPLTIVKSEQLIVQHYNSLTAENEMKFERVHPEPDRYTFDDADKIADFAAKHGKKLRGHTLVWHNQTPDWLYHDKDGNLVDKETLFARMKEHIDTVVGRYKGRIYGWDVVNEVISDDPATMFRSTKFLDIAGESYIAKAFELAHAADPNAILFYNDYNESDPPKRDKIYKLVKSLLDQGVPIHGVGLQGHWNIHHPSIDDIRAAIEKYATLGLQLQVTELDVSVFAFEDRRTDLSQPTAEMVEAQAQYYERIFNLFREYKDVLTAVTFWGAADDYTWLDHFPVRNRKNWPMLFDTKQEPKSAFWRVIG